MASADWQLPSAGLFNGLNEPMSGAENPAFYPSIVLVRALPARDRRSSLANDNRQNGSGFIRAMDLWLNHAGHCCRTPQKSSQFGQWFRGYTTLNTVTELDKIE